MNETDLFKVFINWNTGLLCLGVYLATYVIRTLVETTLPGVKTNKFWTELFLPLGPIATGAIIGLFSHKFPWPLQIADIAIAKIMYGATCGMMCGWMYGRLRAWAKPVEDTTTPVVPPTPPAPPAGS